MDIGRHHRNSATARVARLVRPSCLGTYTRTHRSGAGHALPFFHTNPSSNFNSPEAILPSNPRYNETMARLFEIVLNIIFVPIYIVYSLLSVLVRDVAKSVYGKIVALLAAIVFFAIIGHILHFFR
jgi:hypothetical protein